MNLAAKGKTIRSREDGLQEKIARFRKQEEEVRSLDLAFRDYVAALDTVSKAESRLMAAWAGNIQDTGVSPSYTIMILKIRPQFFFVEISRNLELKCISHFL